MFEKLKNKKIRKLKAYKDIISSLKAIYNIVDDIKLPDILTEEEIELCKKEEKERHRQEEIEREENIFNEIKNNSSNINYIFVGTEGVEHYVRIAEKQKRQEYAKYFDKNGNRIDASKCDKLFNYTKNVCNTRSENGVIPYLHTLGDDIYLAINTEKESRYLLKKNAKSEIVYFSDNITNDDLLYA